MRKCSQASTYHCTDYTHAYVVNFLITIIMQCTKAIGSMLNQTCFIAICLPRIQLSQLSSVLEL